MRVGMSWQMLQNRRIQRLRWCSWMQPILRLSILFWIKHTTVPINEHHWQDSFNSIIDYYAHGNRNNKLEFISVFHWIHWHKQIDAVNILLSCWYNFTMLHKNFWRAQNRFHSIISLWKIEHQIDSLEYISKARQFYFI